MKNKTIAYIRVSSNLQTVENQRNGINQYAINNKMIIDDFIEVEISGIKSQKKRKIDILTTKLNDGDTLIVSELSRLGRSTQDVLKVIDTILNLNVTIIFIKQGLIVSNDTKDTTAKVMITLFSLFAELERDLISQRTKEALSNRSREGIKLGRTKGSLSKSKYDNKRISILELRNKDLSISSIIKVLGFGSKGTLSKWLNSRTEHNQLLNELVFNDKYRKFLHEL